MKNPIVAFLEWYRSLALEQRRYLAHMYTVLTVGNTAELAMAGDRSIEKFERVVTERDFPLRRVARMVNIRATIDFIFNSKDQLAGEMQMAPAIINIADKQWEAGLFSYKDLRARELSDPYIQLWLKAELDTEAGSDG